MTASPSSVDTGKKPLNMRFVGVLNSDYTRIFSDVFFEIIYIDFRCSVRNMNKVIIEYVRYLLLLRTKAIKPSP